ncbi:MAG: hypothetical protein ACI9O1_000980, partial [Candidatus Thalassarchaeaceae archaeon]
VEINKAILIFASNSISITQSISNEVFVIY